MAGAVADVLHVAGRNVGYTEGPANNQNVFAPVAGHANFQPWCASFVVAVCRRAGVKIPNESAYTPTMAQGFKAAKRWGVVPKPGAIVFFEWPSMGRICHVGIVESVNRDGSINTVEGNSNAKGSRTGGSVVRLVRRGSTIAGYGYPAYAATAKKTVSAPVKAPAKPAATLPTLRKGSKNKAAVKTLQALLVKRGFKITLDGDFGPGTEAAVKKAQGKYGAVQDGIVGPKTWVLLNRK